MQGLLLGRYIKKIGDGNAVLFGLASSCVALSMYGLAQAGWMMYVLIICNILSFGTGPALQTIFSRAVDERSQGTAIGSLTALAMHHECAATLIGTSLLGQVSRQAKGGLWLGAPFFLEAILGIEAIRATAERA